MRLSMYLSILFSITMVFYVMGFSAVGTDFLLKNQVPLNIVGGGNSTDVTNDVYYNAGTSEGSILGIIIGGFIVTGVIFAVLILGASSTYIIPLLILMAILNFFVFPINMILETFIADGFVNIFRDNLWLGVFFITFFLAYVLMMKTSLEGKLVIFTPVVLLATIWIGWLWVLVGLFAGLLIAMGIQKFMQQ